jgi:hypothetical protein
VLDCSSGVSLRSKCTSLTRCAIFPVQLSSGPWMISVTDMTHSLGMSNRLRKVCDRSIDRCYEGTTIISMGKKRLSQNDRNNKKKRRSGVVEEWIALPTGDTSTSKDDDSAGKPMNQASKKRRRISKPSFLPTDESMPASCAEARKGKHRSEGGLSFSPTELFWIKSYCMIRSRSNLHFFYKKESPRMCTGQSSC